MFRAVTRIKQALPKEECVGILQREKRGVLSVLGDDDYPYGVPMNFYYDAAENKLYFHSGRHGHKIEALAKHDKVSFCVYDEGFHKDGHWSLNIRSVIVFGRIRTAENWSEEMMIAFCRKFTDDMAYIQKEIADFAANTLVLELDIAHMTGKIINEA